MTFQLYIIIAIAVLIGLFFFLRMRWNRSSESNLPNPPMVSQATPPAVSEDVNLPAAPSEQSPSVPESTPSDTSSTQ